MLHGAVVGLIAIGGDIEERGQWTKEEVNMKRLSVVVALVGVVCVLVASVHGSEQYPIRRFSAGLALRGVQLWGDLKDATNNPGSHHNSDLGLGGEIALRYQLNRYVGLGLLAGYGKVSGEVISQAWPTLTSNYETSLMPVEGLVTVFLLPGRKINPYIAGGGGFTRRSTSDPKVHLEIVPGVPVTLSDRKWDAQEDMQWADKSEWMMSLALTVGAELALNDQWSLDVGVKSHRFSSDFVDYVGYSENATPIPKNSTTLFGATWNPTEPYKDSAKDVVMGGYVRLNYAFGAVVPVKPVTVDRDGDGIPDELDQCPDDPETFNGYEDEDGCPDEVPPPPPPKIVEKPPEVERKALPVPVARPSCSKRVYFATDRYTLDETARTTLNEVVACLKADPEAKMDVRGYTDSAGPRGLNRWLSRKRAETVRDYLVSQGIEADRLRIMRYGEDYPIVSNKTREERAQNRRVDIVRVFALEGINFETNKAELRPSAMAILDQVVKALDEFPTVMVEVGGHADARGTVQYNQRLSEQRAQAVQDYLVKRGIKTVRLKRVGYGELYPVDRRRNPEAWARNRRVEIVEWLPAK